MNAPLPRTNYKVGNRDFKYYIFDWDDNILHMPTHIHLERRLPDGSWIPHRVSTSLFSVIRNDTENYRPPGGDWERAFCEFRDLKKSIDGDEDVAATINESQFLKDARVAIDRLIDGNETPPPSFSTFKQALIEGRIFAIVTARGHDSETLRAGVRLFIDRVLTPAERETMIQNLRGYVACYDGEEHLADKTDEDILEGYLGLNRYHAVTSPQFHRLVNGAIPATHSEARKQFAIKDFLEHVFHVIDNMGVSRPISVGFSDDDPANIRAVEDYIRAELATHFPAVRFVVYDTSDPSIEKGRKIVVSGQLELEL